MEKEKQKTAASFTKFKNKDREHLLYSRRKCYTQRLMFDVFFKSILVWSTLVNVFLQIETGQISLYNLSVDQDPSRPPCNFLLSCNGDSIAWKFWAVKLPL